MKFDLHSHTFYSDGLFSPADLIARAIERKVDVLAITDHDTVRGLGEAQVLCQDTPLQLVNGVEISTRWLDFEIHIVGLAVNPQCPQLLERLGCQQQRRLERAREMARRLTKHNVPDCYETVLAMAGQGALTRTHFARHLVNIGKANSLAGVFKHYLVRGKAGYVPNNWVDMTSAIAWIQDAGGVAVLAHPLKYNLSGKWLTRLVREFSEAGGQAVEVASAQLSPVQKRQVWQLCQQFELVASQGSDFHQPTDWNDLGRGLYLTDDVETVWQRYPQLFPQQTKTIATSCS